MSNYEINVTLDTSQNIETTFYSPGIGPQGPQGEVGPQGPEGPSGGGNVDSVNGYVGVVVLSAGDVNLGNVTNESKSTMFSGPIFTNVVTLSAISTSVDTALSIITPNGSDSHPGKDITIQTGRGMGNTANPVDAGDIYILAGSNAYNASFPGGSIDITAGRGSYNAPPGSVNIKGGPSGYNTSHGDVNITGGLADTFGAGGDVNITGGSGGQFSSRPGTVNISAGLVNNVRGVISLTGNTTITGTISATNLSGTNSGNQVADGITITGTGTALNPFKASGVLTLEQKEVYGNTASTGWIESIVITQQDSTHVNVSAAEGFIIYNTGSHSHSPVINEVLYLGNTNYLIDVASSDITYLLVNISGTLYTQTTYPTPEQRRDNLFIGRISHPNRTSILAIVNTPDIETSAVSQLRDMFGSFRLINSGITPSADGANLSFNISTGKLIGFGINASNNIKDPNQITISAKTPASFFYRTQTGGSTGSVSVIDPNYYDLNGTITAISTSGDGGNNRSTNIRVFQFANGNVVCQYGQKVYDSLALALAGIPTETFVKFSNVSENAILIGIISVRRNSTVLNNTVYAVFTQASMLGEVSASTSGISTTTLQQAYDNSGEPEILTDLTHGSVTIRNGQATNTALVLETKNIAGNTTFSVNGDGTIISPTIDGKENYHGIVSRLTVSPLPTSITTTTFTLACATTPLQYFYNGVSCTISENKTTILSSGAGFYFIYFSDSSGTLRNQIGYPVGHVPVASVWWNGTNLGLVSDERHSYDDGNSPLKAMLHNTVGCRWGNGLDILSLSSTALTLGSGSVWDEDIHMTIAASSDWASPNSYRYFYKSGVTAFLFDGVSTYPFYRGGNGRPNVVNSTGYVLTELPSAADRYVNFFVYATLDVLTPIYIMVETVTNAIALQGGYTSVALARAVPWPSLSGMSLSAEMKPLYRIIVRADGVVQATTSADDYRSVSSLPQSAGTSSTTATAVSFAPFGNIASTTVQTALEELDTEKVSTITPTFRIGLQPGSFNLIGATTEPLLVGVAGNNRSWNELQFTDSSPDLSAGFSLPSSLTTNYKGGTINIKIDFYHTQVTTTSLHSFEFACGLKSLAAGIAPDTAAPTTSTGYSTGYYDVPDITDINELRSIIITLTSPSLVAGDNWIGYIKRLSNGVDYATGIAKVVGITIYE